MIQDAVLEGGSSPHGNTKKQELLKGVTDFK